MSCGGELQSQHTVGTERSGGGFQRTEPGRAEAQLVLHLDSTDTFVGRGTSPKSSLLSVIDLVPRVPG